MKKLQALYEANVIFRWIRKHPSLPPITHHKCPCTKGWRHGRENRCYSRLPPVFENSHSPLLLFAGKSTNEMLKRTILTPRTCKPQTIHYLCNWKTVVIDNIRNTLWSIIIRAIKLAWNVRAWEGSTECQGSVRAKSKKREGDGSNIDPPSRAFSPLYMGICDGWREEGRDILKSIKKRIHMRPGTMCIGPS